MLLRVECVVTTQGREQYLVATTGKSCVVSYVKVTEELLGSYVGTQQVHSSLTAR